MDLEKVVLPELGEGVEDAKVLKINKKVGDIVRKNEVVAEVATDKVDSEIESQFEGRVVHLGCSEGDIIRVGQAILSIQVGADAPSQLSATEKVEQVGYSANSAPNPPIEPVKNIPPAPTISADLRRDFQTPISPKSELRVKHDIFLSPLVSTMIAQNGITQQELASISGTGVNGRVRKADIVQFLENRAKNQALTQANYQDFSEPSSNQVNSNQIEFTPPVNQVSEPEAILSPAPTPSPQLPAQSPVVTNPAVVDIPLRENPVLPTSATPEPTAKSPELTRHGLSFYDNSYAAIDRASYDEFFQTKPKDSVEIVAMSRMRSVIAEHMRVSLDTSAHATLFGEVDVTEMVKWREAEKHKFAQKYSEKLTYTQLVIWIVAQVLPQFPLLNSSIDKQSIILKKNINLGMATALPTGDLIVPVIKNADKLDFISLVQQCNSLAQRARENCLKFTDIEGGTFTISSIGSFGVLHGTPIIQQPQVALLVAGAIKSKPTVRKYEGQTAIVAREIMHLSFGFDHRIIDGMLAGGFLQACSEKMENFTPPAFD